MISPVRGEAIELCKEFKLLLVTFLSSEVLCGSGFTKAECSGWVAAFFTFFLSNASDLRAGIASCGVTTSHAVCRRIRWRVNGSGAMLVMGGVGSRGPILLPKCILDKVSSIAM